MPLIPPETIEQITAANDIVDVIGTYIPLKRAGVMWKALCPFHDERTPSFSVNPQRQIFKCFGCGAGGSVIRFVMAYENLDFISASRKLAKRAGIKMAEMEMSAEDQARYGMRHRLLALHAAATEFFHANLLKRPSAQVARDYLKGRGIGSDIARSWKIGYAPDSFEAFTDFARGDGFSDEELIASGLVKTRDGEENPKFKIQNPQSFYDRFRNRVMFPICNDNGEVIAFSGRVLEADAKAAKYVNSPETMLFTKGSILFGLHKSKRALIGKGSAIICEGQLDLITAFEAGVTNVVAPQGTAFTPKQAHKLKQYVNEVVLCFDADAAGEKAAEKSLPLLLWENLTVRVVQMPPGEDPDSIIRGQGAAAFLKLVDEAKDFFDYQIDRLARRPDFETIQGKMAVARRMAGFISQLTDPILREAVMNKVTLRLELSTPEFARMLKAPAKSPAADTAKTSPEAEPIALDPTIRLLTLIALHDAPARAWLLAEPWARVVGNDPNAGLLMKLLGARLMPGEIGTIHAFLSTLDAAEEAYVSGLLEEKAPENSMTIAHDCWRELERRQLRRRMDTIESRLRTPDLRDDEVFKLQKEILDLKKHLSDIARPLSPPL